MDQKKISSSWMKPLLIWVLPTLAIFLVDFAVFGLVPDHFSVLFLVFIPVVGLCISLIIRVVCSDMKASKKVLCAALLAIVLVGLVISHQFLPYTLHTHTSVNPQQEFEASLKKVFPKQTLTPMPVGAPESLTLHTVYHSYAVFASSTRILLCSYDEADYLTEKNALESRYHFRTELLSTGDMKKTVNPNAEIDGSDFRFIYPADGDAWTQFYRQSLMIATNDSTHKICYVVFEDRDLDVAENLPDFINETCGWELIH